MIQQHMTNKDESPRAAVIFILDWPGACHDAKLTLYQLTLTLILCQLNQGFPRAAWSPVCACELCCYAWCLQVITG